MERGLTKRRLSSWLEALVIIFQVDLNRVLTFPAERYAPRAVYVNGEANWMPFQAVEVETGHCHILRFLGHVEGIEPSPRARSQGWGEAGYVTTMPEVF